MRPGRPGNRPRGAGERPVDAGTRGRGAEIALDPDAAAETGWPDHGDENAGIAYHRRRSWSERKLAIAAIGDGGPEGEPR